ncbi:olfactory receptor 1N1-like [Pelodytes ibericus]
MTKMALKQNHSSIPDFFLLGFQVQHSSKIVVFFILLVVYMITLTGNLLIIGLVAATRHLHSPMYLFLSQLSFSDIMLTTTIIPHLLNITLKHEFCDANIIDHFFCDYTLVLQLSCSDTTAVQTVVLLLGTPEMITETLFIMSSYICIFIAIHQISTNTGRQKAFSTCSSHLIVVCTYYGTLTALYVVPSRGRSHWSKMKLKFQVNVAQVRGG